MIPTSKTPTAIEVGMACTLIGAFLIAIGVWLNATEQDGSATPAEFIAPPPGVTTFVVEDESVDAINGFLRAHPGWEIHAATEGSSGRNRTVFRKREEAR